MNQHSDTLDARKRRRETLQNGEYIAFDLSIMDSASGGKTVFSSDSQRVADRTSMLAAARYNQAVYDASKTALNSWRGGTYAAEHQARAYDAESARETLDTLRKARYS